MEDAWLIDAIIKYLIITCTNKDVLFKILEPGSWKCTIYYKKDLIIYYTHILLFCAFWLIIYSAIMVHVCYMKALPEIIVSTFYVYR